MEPNLHPGHHKLYYKSSYGILTDMITGQRAEVSCGAVTHMKGVPKYIYVYRVPHTWERTRVIETLKWYPLMLQEFVGQRPEARKLINTYMLRYVSRLTETQKGVHMRCGIIDPLKFSELVEIKKKELASRPPDICTPRHGIKYGD